MVLSGSKFQTKHFFADDGRQEQFGYLFIVHKVLEDDVVNRVRYFYHNECF